MFKKLTIRNFQAHKKKVLVLDPHITTIVGPNSAGKTAILRALKWICTNRPSGSDFVGDWGKAPFVSATLQLDHTTVKRKKGRSNTYALGKKVYRSFGSNVPEDVQTVLNVSELNFQGQHDSPFWFSLSPGRVSKELNEIVNLSEMDTVQQSLASQVRKAKTNVELTHSRYVDVKEELASLDWVADAQQVWDRIQQVQKQRDQTHEDAVVLTNLLQDVAKYRTTKDTSVQLVQSGLLVLQKRDQLVAASKSLGRLDVLLEKILEVSGTIRDLRLEVQSAEKQVHKLTKSRCPLCARPM